MTTRYLNHWPSGVAPEYFVQDNWIYEMNGKPAFHIQEGWVYTISGLPAFWIDREHLYPHGGGPQPEVYFA